MKQSPFWDAKSRSASQEIVEHECSLQCSQQPSRRPYPELVYTNPQPHILLL